VARIEVFDVFVVMMLDKVFGFGDGEGSRNSQLIERCE
jgi:hypothetical protein